MTFECVNGVFGAALYLYAKLHGDADEYAIKLAALRSLKYPQV
jgi:hypothetical protein